MQREGESKRERQQERARARDGSRQAASLVFLLHIHTTGKNHQRQSVQGAKQTSSEAHIGSTLLSVTRRLAYLGGSTGGVVEACPFLATQPAGAQQCALVPVYISGVWLLWAHTSALLGTGEGAGSVVQTLPKQSSGHWKANVTKVHENFLSLFFLPGPGREAAGS